MKRLFVAGAFAVLLITGCVTTPTPQAETSVAGYVGDRATVELNEVIATVVGGKESWQNLHVSVGVAINPRRVTVYQPYEVESIVRRLEPRISAQILAETLGKSITVANLREWRDRISSVAQNEIDEALARWTEAASYEVRATVLSMYFTDGSVGRASAKRWW